MRVCALALAVAVGTMSVAAVMALPESAHAQAANYPTYEDVGLVWTRSPSVRDMARFYRTTRHDGLRGMAHVLCTATASGQLDCDVIDEEPTDRQFGLAGVRVMERARVATRDGSSPAGRQFAYTLRFGNWPPHLVPDRFHPTDQHLVWIDRPTLVGLWNLRGQERGERFSATVDCVAQADGSLSSCHLISADNPDFGEAAVQSMALATVSRSDSGELAGSPLRWTIAVERQSSCGAASSGSGRSGSYPATGTGIVSAQSLAAQAGVAGASGADGGGYGYGPVPGAQPNDIGGGMPGCQSAMVQVHGGQ